MKASIHLFLIIIFNNCLHAQISDFKSMDFTRADYIAESNKGSSLDNLPILAYELTNALPTQVEKFRAIYVWVCNNVDGDNSQYNKISKKRKKLKNDSIALMKWNNDYKRIAFKKLLEHKKTICTGYAYLIKELCYLANVESVIVNGYGRTVDSNINELEIANHSWNAVKLNDKWYLCDATWSSGHMDEYNSFVKDYNNGYFLTDPILFGQNHFPLDQRWLLDENVTVSTFVNAPLVYGETFEYEIKPICPQEMDVSTNKNDEIEFRFKSTKTNIDENIALVHYVGIKERDLKIYNLKNENDIISFNYRFKHKGIYDTHLKINDDIVATYTIKVTKRQSKLQPS